MRGILFEKERWCDCFKPQYKGGSSCANCGYKLESYWWHREDEQWFWDMKPRRYYQKLSGGLMQKENDLWQKSYECNCHGEMIMMGYENDEKDGIPTIDLAFFNYGHGNNTLSFSNKLRWIWHILITGKPFLDEVMLDQETAKRLGDDLIEFSQKKYINASSISSSSSSKSTLSAKGLRIKCDKEIEELRKNCVHPDSTICEEQWAPGHLTGKKVKVCNICEKVI